MRLTLTLGFKSWLNTLPPGGTISVRWKTVEELEREKRLAEVGR